MQNYKFVWLIFLFIISPSLFAATLNTYEYNVPYKSGLFLHLKEKTLSVKHHRRVIVLLNPLSIPSLEAFDVPGYSLMDTFAKKGFDVWAIDFIAQGKASFPSEMTKTPAPTGIFPLRATEAAKQLHYAIDFIQHETQQETFALLGWSWGSIIAAMYTIDHPKQIDHLILYGAMYSTSLPKPAQRKFVLPFADNNGVFKKILPAYQNIPWTMIQSHWDSMIGKKKAIATQQAFKAVEKTYLHIDPNPIEKNTLRRAMGPMNDLFLIWTHHPLYDINALRTPTLVIYGQQDFFADRQLFSKLVNVHIKKEVIIENATHWLIYENNRDKFNNNVIDFLNQ